jgi:hypothetical protein
MSPLFWQVAGVRNILLVIFEGIFNQMRKIYIRVLFLLCFILLKTGVIAQERFVINGAEFYASSIVYDDNGDIYLLVTNFKDSINIGGVLLDGTPTVFPYGTQKSTDMAVVKLNPDLSVAWIDVIQGETAISGPIGSLQFDELRNLYLFVWSSSGTKVFFSNGYILEKNYQTDDKKRALVTYNKTNGSIVTIEPFSFYDNSLHWASVKFLPNDKWLIQGYHYGYKTIRGIDTVFNHPKPGFIRASSFLALFNRQTNTYEWKTTLTSSSDYELSRHFRWSNAIVLENEVFFRISFRDSLYLEDQLLDFHHCYATGLCRVELDNGNLAYKVFSKTPCFPPSPSFVTLAPFQDGLLAQINVESSLIYNNTIFQVPKNGIGLYHAYLDRDYNINMVIPDTTLNLPLPYSNSLVLGDEYLITHLARNTEKWHILGQEVAFESKQSPTLLRALVSKDGKLKGIYEPISSGGFNDYGGIYAYGAQSHNDHVYEHFYLSGVDQLLGYQYDTTYGGYIFELNKNIISGYITPERRVNNLFPTFFNESQKDLTLVLKEDKRAEIAYYDLSGRVLKTYVLMTVNGVLHIPIPQASLSQGIYILRIEIPGRPPIIQKLLRM